MTHTSFPWPTKGQLWGRIRRLSLIQQRAASPNRHLDFFASSDTIQTLAAQQRAQREQQKQDRIAARKTDHFESSMPNNWDPESVEGRRWIYARRIASLERHQARYEQMLNNMATALGLTAMAHYEWVAKRMEKRKTQRKRRLQRPIAPAVLAPFDDAATPKKTGISLTTPAPRTSHATELTRAPSTAVTTHRRRRRESDVRNLVVRPA